MAKTTHLLFDIQIRRWIANEEPAAKSDGDGLTFTLAESGSAAWLLRYRSGRRRKELALANYPDLGLAGARAKRLPTGLPSRWREKIEVEVATPANTVVQKPDVFDEVMVDARMRQQQMRIERNPTDGAR